MGRGVRSEEPRVNNENVMLMRDFQSLMNTGAVKYYFQISQTLHKNILWCAWVCGGSFADDLYYLA